MSISGIATDLLAFIIVLRKESMSVQFLGLGMGIFLKLGYSFQFISTLGNGRIAILQYDSYLSPFGCTKKAGLLAFRLLAKNNMIKNNFILSYSSALLRKRSLVRRIWIRGVEKFFAFLASPLKLFVINHLRNDFVEGFRIVQVVVGFGVDASARRTVAADSAIFFILAYVVVGGHIRTAKQ